MAMYVECAFIVSMYRVTEGYLVTHLPFEQQHGPFYPQEPRSDVDRALVRGHDDKGGLVHLQAQVRDLEHKAPLGLHHDGVVE